MEGEIVSLASLLPQTEESVSIEDTLTPTIVEAEEVQTENPETITEEPQEEQKPQTASEPSIFKQYVQKKIESGEWDDIEDFETLDIDEETFDEIVARQAEEKIKKVKESTIKTDSLSPLMLKAIEIDKNGGNVSEVLETYRQVYENPIAPISSMDLDNPAHQEQLLRYYHQSKGLKASHIEAIVDNAKKNLTLATDAVEAKAEIDQVFENYMVAQAQKAEQEKAAKVEQQKQYKNAISEEAKKYQLNDNFRKLIVDKLSKTDDKGQYGVDELYNQWRDNPETAVKLAMFLQNEEEYIKIRAEKMIQESKRETFNKIKLTGKRTPNGAAPETSVRDKSKEVISLQDLM